MTNKNNMNKVYALKSQHSASQGVTRYLMPGRRHQLTRSLKWAQTFTSRSEACYLAMVIGGMEVVSVEVEVSK